MPLYFFDYKDDAGDDRDSEGSSLPSLEKACALAVGLLPDMASYSFRRCGHHEFSITVRDDTGRALYRATLSFRGEMLE